VGRNRTRLFGAIFLLSALVAAISCVLLIQSFRLPQVWQRATRKNVSAVMSSRGGLWLVSTTVLDDITIEPAKATMAGWRVQWRYPTVFSDETTVDGVSNSQIMVSSTSADFAVNRWWGFGRLWRDMAATNGPAGVTPRLRMRAIVVPYWPALLVSLTSATLAGRWLVDKRRQRLRLAGRCICGYDLRASSSRCPECGTPMPKAISPSTA
jgi:hypothetical protein